MKAILSIALVIGLGVGFAPTASAQDDEVAAEPTADPTAAPTGPRLREPAARLRAVDTVEAAEPRLVPQLRQPGLALQPRLGEGEALRLAPPGGDEEEELGDEGLVEDEVLDDALDDGFGDDALFGQDVAEAPTLAEDGHGEHAEGAEGEHAEGAHGDEHGAHGAGADHGEHEAHFDPVEFGATLLNFVIWLAIVVWLLRKPLLSHLAERRRAVEEGLVEAERLEKEAKTKHAEYSARLARLDEELEKLRGEMISAGEAEADRIIAEAEQRAARMRKDAEFVIAQQLKQLRADLTREAIEAAIAAAESVLTENVGTKDQEQLAEEYLAQLASSIEEVRA